MTYVRINDILLPKLFWPTVRKNCSSDQENFLKFEADGQEFANYLRSLEQFFLTVSQNNFGNKIPFLFNIKKNYLSSCFWISLLCSDVEEPLKLCFLGALLPWWLIADFGAKKDMLIATENITELKNEILSKRYLVLIIN